MQGRGQQTISIIIPVLNEALALPALLRQLQPLRLRGHEVIVVDGGSEDGTPELVQEHCDQVIHAPRGRAVQMARGLEAACGSILWFLHADVLPPDNADRLMIAALSHSGRGWGRFDVTLQGRHPLLRLIGRMMNLRSRITGIATGDQGIFVLRPLLEQIGGMPLLPLMEDIELSKLLKASCKPLFIDDCITVSSRRWRNGGIVRTMLLMWYLRLLYAVGVSPARLARLYL